MPASERYDVLLKALYDRSAAPPPEIQRPIRFEIERDRRILDIARILSVGWPRTCYHERAHSGDAFIFGTAALIAEFRYDSRTTNHAVERAAGRWMRRQGDRLSQALFDFEQVRRGNDGRARPPTEAERDELRGRGVTGARVLDVDFDILTFIGSLDFLHSRGAPAAFVRDLEPTGKPMSVAFYSRGGKVLAAAMG